MRVAVSGGTSGIGAALVREGEARGWKMMPGSRRNGLDGRSETSIEEFFTEPVDAVHCAGVFIDG